MALNPHLSNAAASAAADAVAALANTGYLRFYDGSQPATADTAITTQNKLAELRFGATAFGASANGVATANAITSDTNTVAGTVAWFRALKSDGTSVLFDGSVGTSGCDINLNTTAIATGGTLAITAFTYTQAKS